MDFYRGERKCLQWKKLKEDRELKTDRIRGKRGRYSEWWEFTMSVGREKKLFPSFFDWFPASKPSRRGRRRRRNPRNGIYTTGLPSQKLGFYASLSFHTGRTDGDSRFLSPCIDSFVQIHAFMNYIRPWHSIGFSRAMHRKHTWSRDTLWCLYRTGSICSGMLKFPMRVCAHWNHLWCSLYICS